MKRVLVCGGRDFDNKFLMETALSSIIEGEPIIIHGAARGADSMAGQWAAAKGLRVLAFPADWGANGKAAGPLRNIKMLEQGQPDLVIAFPGGKGTAHMVEIAEKAGIPVIQVVDFPNGG
jgi:hypothetical protein